MIKKKPKKIYKIVLSGDVNADWLKYIDGGKHQQADLAAHDYAENLEKERREKDGKE